MSDPVALPGQPPAPSALSGVSGPLSDLVLVVPIFVVYHLAVIFLPVRNAADMVTRELTSLAKNDMLLYGGLTLGVGAVIVADAATDLFNPNCIRASLGTVFDKNVCEATSAETVAWLAGRGAKIFTAQLDAQVNYAQADYRGDAAIVLGSEAHGLSSEWQSANRTPIKLPMLGAADSLNVSATAAVLFYEALRQRSGE